MGWKQSDVTIREWSRTYIKATYCKFVRNNMLSNWKVEVWSGNREKEKGRLVEPQECLYEVETNCKFVVKF